MNCLLATGTSFFSIALLFYTFSLIKAIRENYCVTFKLSLFINIGLIFDILAIILVSIYSEEKNVEITAHGILGYISTFLVMIDAIFIFRLRRKNKYKKVYLGKGLAVYGLIAYAIWLVAFFSGMSLEF